MHRHKSRWACLTSLAVFILALVPRLPGLDVFLTADEPKSWFGRSIQFLDALVRADWAATFDSPAPGVTTMWAGTMGLLLEYARQGFPGDLSAFLAAVPFDPLDPSILPLVRLPIVLVAAAAAALTYLWGRSFLGETASLLAALLLAFDPFLLALSRVLGHDALVAIFMWLALLAFLRAYSSHFGSSDPDRHADVKPDRRYLLLSGALGGLAFLTKYPALFLGAFVAGVMLILHVGRRRPWPQVVREWVGGVMLWSLAAGLVYVALWPAMWVDPLGRVMTTVNDVLRASGSPHQKGSFFMGSPVSDPGLGFYPLVSLFRTTPVIWLGWLLLLGQVLRKTDVARRLQAVDRSWGRAALGLLAYALLFGVLVTLGGKKQDRYVLPAFPALYTLAALGYSQFLEKLNLLRKGDAPRLSHIGYQVLRVKWLLPLVVLAQLAFVLPHHPYYFTYYNPLMGGGKAAARTMIVGWGEGLDQAARWLNTLPDSHNLDVVSWYSTTFEPFFFGNAIYKIEEEKISRSPKPALAADYVVFYINQTQRELPSPGTLQYFQVESPVHTVTLHGIDYAQIYPSVGMQHVIGGEARLVGQAELLGYDLVDELDRPVTVVHPDSVFYLSLYWEWRGKAEDDPIGVSLVDADGVTRGWGNPIQTVAPLPFDEWQEGMVVRDDFALVIFADTPQGDYRLAAWIDRPKTGETVGVFPLESESEAEIRVQAYGNK